MSLNMRLMIAALLGALASDVHAEGIAKPEGTWELVSSVNEIDGRKMDQFGSHPTGRLTLGADGHFMLTIIGADLPKFASNNRASGTSDENKAVMSRSIAMIGSYVIKPDEKVLIFRTESATFPNWNGTEQRRLIVTLSADELKYVTPTASGGGVGTVTWKRMGR